MSDPYARFHRFAAPTPVRNDLRLAVTSATRRPETACLSLLLKSARVSEDDANAILEKMDPDEAADH